MLRFIENVSICVTETPNNVNGIGYCTSYEKLNFWACGRRSKLDLFCIVYSLTQVTVILYIPSPRMGIH